MYSHFKWHHDKICIDAEVVCSYFNEKLVYKRICAMYGPIFLKNVYKVETQSREIKKKRINKENVKMLSSSGTIMCYF